MESEVKHAPISSRSRVLWFDVIDGMTSVTFECPICRKTATFTPEQIRMYKFIECPHHSPPKIVAKVHADCVEVDVAFRPSKTVKGL